MFEKTLDPSMFFLFYRSLWQQHKSWTLNRSCYEGCKGCMLVLFIETDQLCNNMQIYPFKHVCYVGKCTFFCCLNLKATEILK